MVGPERIGKQVGKKILALAGVVVGAADDERRAAEFGQHLPARAARRRCPAVRRVDNSASIRRAPSATARKIALRSAQIDRPNDAFSTLAPVCMRPSEHNTAAPTAKRE